MTTATDLKYLDDLGIDTGDFSVFADSSEFALSGRSLTLKAGASVPFVATVGGQTFEAHATLHEANWRRVTLQDHLIAKQGNRATQIIGGSVNGVRMDISIEMGDREVTLPQLLMDLANKQIIEDGGSPVDWDTFVKTITRMGMPLVPDLDHGVNGTMPIIWQHFGVSEDGVNQAFGLFEKYNAKAALPRGTTKITRALELTRGFQVVQMEIGRVDRSATQHANKTITLEDGSTQVIDGVGFLDFPDAVISAFKRGLVQRKIRKILKAELEAAQTAPKPKAEEIAILEERIKNCTALSQSWIGNWSGGARRILPVQADGISRYDVALVDPTPAPCGRIVVLVDGEEIEIDFWKQPGDTTVPTTKVIDTTQGESGVTITDEEPF